MKSKYSLLYITLITLSSLSLLSCAMPVPKAVPFLHIEKADSSVSKTLIYKRNGYVTVYLFIDPPHGSSMPVEEYYNRIADFTGGDQNPKKVYTGISVHLSVTKNQNGQKIDIMDKDIVTTSDDANGSMIALSSIYATKGEYTFTVKASKDDPRLNDWDAYLNVFAIHLN